MRKFLSNFLLVIFIVVFAVPVEALAGSWTPPSGPPQDNNTPAPINVGDNDQTKIGGLNLQSFLNVLGNTNIAGDTKIGTGNVSPGFKLGVFGSISFDSNVSSDTFASYLRNNAFTGGGNFWIGRSGNPWAFGYPRVQINAREFSFLQRNNDNGQIINPPQPGHVLTALNTDGLIGWAPAPSGGGGGGGNIRVMKNGAVVVPAASMLDITFPVGGQDMVQVTQTGPNSAQLFLNTDLMGGNGGGGGSSTFTGLTDTPANYTGSANRVLTVSPDETGVRFSPLDSILPPNGLRLTNDGQNINGIAPPGIVTDLDVSISSQDPSSPFLEVVGEPPSTAYLKFNSGKLLPAGTAGQTLWYNGQTNRWEAMSRLRHEDPFGLGPNRTVIENDNLFLDISGNLRVGKLTPNNISPTNALGVTTLQSGQTRAMSPVVNFIPHNMIPGSTQTVNLNSNTVNFSNPNNTNNQTVSFYADNIEIRGSNTEMNAVKPGLGRIPFSVSQTGRFSWNPDFIYNNFIMTGQQITSLLTGVPANPQPGNTVLGMLRLKLPSPPAPWDSMPKMTVFRNEGFTILDQHVSIEQGDLFLQNISSPMNEKEASRLAHLCIDPQTKKVLKCDPLGSSPVPEVYYSSQTFYPGQTSFTFPAGGSATVKYCAGAGSGGGGGAGINPAAGDGAGAGGGAGGGGGRGECYSVPITVASGDQLTFNIGEGGINSQSIVFGGQSGPGAGGFIQVGDASLNSNPQNGQSGQNTNVSFNGSSIGPIALGGSPGLAGQNAGSGNPGNGGVGGDNTKPWSSGWDAWWHRGENGFSNTSSECPSCGGLGGDGWYYRDEPGWPGEYAGDINPPFPSAGGKRGVSTANYSDTCPSTQQSNLERRGGNGMAGAPSYGGGGGGGGFGQSSKIGFGLPGGCVPSNLGFFGGFGGPGGPGYVQVIYPVSSESTGPNHQTFASAGTSQFDLMTLPTNNPDSPGAPARLRIKLWGGGGGGGPISNLSGGDQAGGGGGSGGYKEVVWTIPESIRNCIAVPGTQGCLPAFNLNVIVGAGGNIGNSPSTTTGSSGGETRVTYGYIGHGGSPGVVLQGGSPVVMTCVGGGAGGASGNPNGVGGAGGTDVCAGLSATPGNAGLNGQEGGQGGAPVGAGGGGGGGRGSSRIVTGGIGQNFPGSNGQDGKVVISWEW